MSRAQPLRKSMVLIQFLALPGPGDVVGEALRLPLNFELAEKAQLRYFSCPDPSPVYRTASSIIHNPPGR